MLAFAHSAPGTSPGRLMRHSPFPHPASELPLERNPASADVAAGARPGQADAEPLPTKSSRFRGAESDQAEMRTPTRPRPCRPTMQQVGSTAGLRPATTSPSSSARIR